MNVIMYRIKLFITNDMLYMFLQRKTFSVSHFYFLVLCVYPLIIIHVFTLLFGLQFVLVLETPSCVDNPFGLLVCN